MYLENLNIWVLPLMALVLHYICSTIDCDKHNLADIKISDIMLFISDY